MRLSRGEIILKIVNPPVRLKYRDNSANIEVYMQCGEIEKIRS
jgi:hypothetical protein